MKTIKNGTFNFEHIKRDNETVSYKVSVNTRRQVEVLTTNFRFKNI